MIITYSKIFSNFLKYFYVRKAFKIKGLKELYKIKWFTQNLKRRKFHSTSTEDRFGIMKKNS